MPQSCLPRIAGSLPMVFLGIACLLTGSVSGAEDKPAPVAADHPQKIRAGLEEFRKHVRPLFIKHCLDCHGGKSVKAGFDLSNRKALLESGAVDADAESSFLYAVLTHAEEPHMPHKADRLPANDLAHIAKWIDLGAPYDKPLVDGKKEVVKARVVTDTDRQFWSFAPLQPGAIPAVQQQGWARTPLDQFILAAQEKQGLHPNPDTSRRLLIRRAYFDLLGLPPTPEEVDRFVADNDPQAYDRLLDRLLDSPHYGERWARHWMDVARFAESHGYEQDYNRKHAYHYRDFLIKAFNADLPFDTFIRWQIAGDELEPANPLALMATGFLGAGAFPTQLTEAEFESARYDELDDMVGTIGTSFLGLSVGCARCHDHKFDPIPTRDYYRMLATFSTTIRSEIELDLEPETNRQRRVDYEAELVRVEQQRRKLREVELPARLKEYVASYDAEAPSPGPWEMLSIESVRSSGGTVFVEQNDGSYLATGGPPAKEVITVVARTFGQGYRAFRLEALADPSLPRQGPGRAANGNFALGKFTITAQPLDGKSPAKPVTLSSAEATFQQNESSLSVAASIDADPVSGWAVDGGIGKDQAAVFHLRQPVGEATGTRLTFILTFEHPNTRHAVGRFRLSAARVEHPVVQVSPPQPSAEIRQALSRLQKSPDEQSPDWKLALGWYALQQPDLQRLEREWQALKKAGPKLVLTKVQVSSEGLPHLPHHADGRGYPHFYPQVFLLQRGDVHQKQGEVSPGYLQVLMRDGQTEQHWQSPAPSGHARASGRRTAFARWLTDPQQGAGHLAARVIVNRLWQHHFGRGLVATPNDFGLQGEAPTHPKLLDWLAEDLIAHGWQLKRMHRLMMTSSLYRQSSAFDEARATLDRENTFYWRREPRRLEGEAIRDALLCVAGTLDQTMYGPGSLDPNMHRRSVYFFIKRSQLIPMMMLFDWPEHLVGIGQRSSTTTAPQALVFMNSPLGRQAATAFADRLADKPLPEAISYGYRLALGRLPDAREKELATAFVKRQSQQYRSAGESGADRLALVNLCQAILSMNEFVYVD